MTRRAAIVLLIATCAASPAAAQDSVFGIRGLGFPGTPGTARSEAMGGSYGPFDGGGVQNPASLAAWNGSAGWAVAAASRRSFDQGTGGIALTSVRFPLFGFATPVGQRLVVGVSVADYLSRNWTVARGDTVSPRDTTLAVNDQTKSQGGVSDVRLAAAWRASDRLTVGLGVHVLTGSAENSVTRTFPFDPAYIPFTQSATTAYTGVGVSAGALVTPLPRLILGASVRINSRLKASSPDTTLRVQLPLEFNVAAYYAPTARLIFTAMAARAGWGAASSDLVAAGLSPSRDTWSASFGAQATALRLARQDVPLRVGYRWRQLPFAIGTASLNENAVTFGLGLAAGGGRAAFDLTGEVGSRRAGALTENFTTLLLGVSILP